MKTVSRFEANLLRILQGFFGHISPDQLLKLVETEMDGPRCLSRNAVQLAQDTLKKGVPIYLAKRGGWRRERFLRFEQIHEGRLWNRTPPEELAFRFSQHSLEFLIWITANHPNRSNDRPLPEPIELTIGDRLLHFLAYESLRGTEPARGLMEQPPFANHALIWLAFPSDLWEIKAKESWDFAPWMGSQGSCALECLQTQLTNTWLQMERQKHRIYQPAMIQRFGDLQHQLLCSFFDAVDTANRRDLCRFFLIAMKQYLHESIASGNPTATGWGYQLDLGSLKIAERSKVYRSAVAPFRQMARIDKWNRIARATGFYDEGYAAAQLWNSDWEQLHGDQILNQTEALLNRLEPLSWKGSQSGQDSRQNDSA